MSDGITAEDREKLMHLKNQNIPDRNSSEPEYEPVEGYKHLDVLKAGKRYKVEYSDSSVSIPGNRVDRISLSNFLEDYIDTGNFDEAHRQNYKSKSRKAEEFLPLLESQEDLTDDLSRLADELDPQK